MLCDVGFCELFKTDEKLYGIYSKIFRSFVFRLRIARALRTTT